jgi:hypothetical protein
MACAHTPSLVMRGYITGDASCGGVVRCAGRLTRAFILAILALFTLST